MANVERCLAVITVLLLSGCATQTEYVEIEPDPSIQEYLLIFPLNDVRDNKRIALVDFPKGSNQIKYPVSTSWMVRNRSCIVRFTTDNNLEQNVSYDDLQNENIDMLKKLSHNEEKYALILYINQLEFVYFEAKCAISGYLVDIPNGKVVWKSEASNTRKAGVLNQVLFQDSVINPAFQVYSSTLTELFSTFPNLKKTEIKKTPEDTSSSDSNA